MVNKVPPVSASHHPQNRKREKTPASRSVDIQAHQKLKRPERDNLTVPVSRTVGTIIDIKV